MKRKSVKKWQKHWDINGILLNILMRNGINATIQTKCQHINNMLVILSSLPHFQDFLAVQELQKEGKIPKKSVFIPGHCGNLIAGDCLPRKILEISPDFDHFVTYYRKEHYSALALE